MDQDPSDLSPPRLDGLGVKGSANRGLLTLNKAAMAVAFSSEWDDLK